MLAREIERSRDGVAFRISADRYYRDLLRIATQALHHRVQFLGGQRALIGATGVQECQHHRFPFELRERDLLAELISQAKIGSGLTAQVGPLQAGCARIIHAGIAGYSGRAATLMLQQQHQRHHQQRQRNNRDP